MIKLKKTLGRDYKVHESDVVSVKAALQKMGYYERPEYGITPYPDERMFESIKSFQRDNHLKIDGIMKPDGETLEALNAKYQNDLPGVRSPTSWCPQCGGPHGGSKGDLCPDCDSKT